MYFRYNDYYRVAVKAYTSVIPILVNGEDINVPPYPSLNYQPYPTIPAYSYVPIAMFSKVGASVRYDENTNTIYVNSLCNEYKQKLDTLRAMYDEDTKNIFNSEDLLMARDADPGEMSVFQIGSSNTPILRQVALDFIAKYPIGTYVKYFRVTQMGTDGRPISRYVWLKPEGSDWVFFGP